MGQFLLGRDTVNGAEGSVVVTIDGRNSVVAGMRNITANAEIQSNDMRVIGTRKIQAKNNGAKLTGTGNVYYGFDYFRKMALEYVNTGVSPEFALQITNDDPATSLGRQVTAIYGCQLTGTIPLAILNSEEAMLNYDFTFSYSRIADLESFNAPSTYGIE